MNLKELEALEKAATPGPWWANGLDIESSHVIVAEGEKWVQLYNTETGEPSRLIKPHQRTDKDDTDDDDIVILSTSSILGDRDFEEAQATADLIVGMRNALPALLAEVKAAREWLRAYEPGLGVKGTYDVTSVNRARDAYRKIVEANDV